MINVDLHNDFVQFVTDRISWIGSKVGGSLEKLLAICLWIVCLTYFYLKVRNVRNAKFIFLLAILFLWVYTIL